MNKSLPVDQEQYFLIEDLYKTVEKMEETQEMNMTNKVNIEFLREQLDKALKDIEDLKDKVRANGGSMTELIIALLMIVNGEIKEHRIQETMSDV